MNHEGLVRAGPATGEVCPTRPFLSGAKAIASYLGKKEKWFRRQRERGKNPPPHWKLGAGIAAYPDELDAWRERWANRTGRGR